MLCNQRCFSVRHGCKECFMWVYITFMSSYFLLISVNNNIFPITTQWMFFTPFSKNSRDWFVWKRLRSTPKPPPPTPVLFYRNKCFVSSRSKRCRTWAYPGRDLSSLQGTSTHRVVNLCIGFLVSGWKFEYPEWTYTHNLSTCEISHWQ